MGSGVWAHAEERDRRTTTATRATARVNLRTAHLLVSTLENTLSTPWVCPERRTHLTAGFPHCEKSEAESRTGSCAGYFSGMFIRVPKSGGLYTQFAW